MLFAELPRACLARPGLGTEDVATVNALQDECICGVSSSGTLHSEAFRGLSGSAVWFNQRRVTCGYTEDRENRVIEI